MEKKTRERIYKASSRGVGRDYTNGCFVGTCGTKPDALTHNIACFVPSRETGEAIVAMFIQGARLDYREFTPNRVQVKIGACEEHLANIELLHELIETTRHRKDGPGLTRSIILQAIAGGDSLKNLTDALFDAMEDLCEPYIRANYKFEMPRYPDDIKALVDEYNPTNLPESKRDVWALYHKVVQAMKKQ